MAELSERSVDRRSLYTKSLVKGSLLELLKTHSYTSISVTMLSEKAGIGRNTFYRHFNNTFEVLEAAIDDALMEMFTAFDYLGIGTHGMLATYVAPLCEYIKSSERYRTVFSDPELAAVVIGRLLLFDGGRFVNVLATKRGCTRKQAEAVVRFQMAGVLEVCGTYAHVKDDEWAEIVKALGDLV